MAVPKLNEHDVEQIKHLLLANELTQKEIGLRFDVSRSTISDIATGRIYKDVAPNLMPVKIAGGQTKHLNLEQQNLALIGQLENTRQERNLLKRQLIAAAKRDAVVDEIARSLTPAIKPMKAPKKISLKPKSRAIEETLVLLLSDVHADQIVTPEEVDGLEQFDFPVAVCRAETLIQDMLNFCLTSLSNFRFKKLVIFGLGDYTSGEIHGHVNKSYFQDQFKNDLAIAQLFAYMFTELSAHFDEIEVVSIIGNHGRLTDKIEYTKEAVSANHDTLIMKIAEIHCKKIKNLSFLFPDGLSHIYDIDGWNFYLHHGHGKRSGSDIWTRAKRKSQTIVPLHRGSCARLWWRYSHWEWCFLSM
jgi:transcriptional regulator with XRE-family HTH domain